MPYGRTTVKTITPTITAGIYGAADVVGGLLTLSLDSVGSGGKLMQIMVADDADQKAELTFYFYDSLPNTIADNAPFAPTAATDKLLVGKVVVAVADYATVNSNATAFKAGQTGFLLCYSGRTLYAYAVATATPTYAAVTDLTFRFTFSED